jgi:Icc-related predicted phosphoesterase
LTKIFFATDVHGSDKCWMKFINSAKFYGADVLILGGDLTAKGFIAMIEQPDGKFRTNFRGKELVVNPGKELEDLEKEIRYRGLYTVRTTPQELESFESEAKREELVLRLALEQVERWMRIVDERLQGTGIRLFLTAGNDDPFEVDEILKKSQCAMDVEGKVIQLDEDHEMISTGYGNLTPWKCPRDISEEELAKKIEAMASQVKNMQNCIFNLHVPPFDSRLDDAPELDKELRPTYSASKLVPVGSKAVRAAIEKYQPLLGLHGHIHESKGNCKIGRTLCLNPGSTYTDGILLGFLIEIDKKGVKRFSPTSG